MKKDYLQGSATAWAPSTDCLALKPLLPEVGRPTGHGIHHTFDIALRVKNAEDMGEIQIICLLKCSHFIHKIWDQRKGNIKTPIIDADKTITKNSTLHLAAAVP